MADKRLEVVVGIARNERPDDVEPVGQRGKSGERAAEGYARQARGDLAGRAADALGAVHFRVKRLELAGTAVQEQEDDRLAG